MDKIKETDIAAIAAKAGISPKGRSAGIPADLGGGLVFEFDTDEQEERPTQAKPEPAPEIPKITEPARAPEEVAAEQDLSEPELSRTPELTDNIRTTYVPRFTEVSETYRMKDDPRPRRKDPEEHTVVTKIEAPEEPSLPEASDPLDPTAEMEETTEGILVSMDRPTPDENSEVLNVYKFKAESQPQEAASPHEEEEELKKLLKSLGREMPEPVEEPEKEEEIEQELPEEDYSMPDPGAEDITVRDFEAKKEYVQIDPDGVSDATPEMPKKHATEFTHQTQRDAFKDKFLDSLMSLKIRLVAAILFFAGILGFEVLAALGKIGYTVFDLSYNTGGLAAIDLLVITCMYLFALPETVRAIKKLISGVLTPELMLSAAYLVSAAYLIVTSSGVYTNYPLFGSIFAVIVLCTIIASYSRVSADFTAFKLIALSKEKRILDRKMTRELPEENMALDGLIDEYSSRTARVFRSGFITDFFKKTSCTAEKPKHTALILAVTFGVALVAGAISYFTGDGLLSAMSTLNLVVLLGIPAVTVLSHKISYHDAQSTAHSEESTVVGECSYLDFAEVNVIAFEDSEIFGPDDVALKRFMLYGDSENMEKAMRQMCALFGVVGGPLHYIFSNSLDNRMRITPAARPVIEEDGISGDVGGRRIAAGTEEYMRRSGVAIPEGASRSESGIDTTKIMYASEDGEVFAKFYIRYSFSEEFTMLLPTLKEEGIVPLIYTGDPNVSNDLLKMLSAGSDCMRVMKRLTPVPEDDKLYSRVSAGIVTYGDKINAIDVLLLTKKYKRFLRALGRAEGIVMAVGTLAGVILSLVGAAIPACFLAIWQLLLCAVLRVASARILSPAESKDKKED